MSSEMRELVIRALQSAYAHGEKHAPFALHDCARQIVDAALLARTEAGADGAIYQMMATDEDVDEDGNVRPDDPRLWMDHSRDEYERLKNHPSVRSRIVYTHPQDASGDADAAYAILDRLTTTREGCLQLAKVIYRELDKVEKLLDEAVEQCAAMQAKEAK